MRKIVFILYAFFLLLFVVFSYTFIDHNLFYLKSLYSGFAFTDRLLVTFLYLLSIAIFFISYRYFFWFFGTKKAHIKEISILIAITIGILFFSYPAMLSYDIFNYIATSKVLFFYHENPYVVMPIEFTREPVLSFTRASNKIALYGPIWIFLTGIPYFLGLGNFLVTLFSFKLLVTFFYLSTTLLIYKISKNIIPVILFAFNPLIIIETLISGHNDIVMIFFAILSYFLLMKKKIFFAILLFILSVLIKYATVFLLPVFFYAVWKTIKAKEVNWKNIFYYSSLAMLVGFLLSPIREEIYSWYAIWFLSFAFLIPHKKLLLNLSLIFSFSLLLRYIPHMFTGTYIGYTPILKEIISFGFPTLFFLYYVLKKKI